MNTSTSNVSLAVTFPGSGSGILARERSSLQRECFLSRLLATASCAIRFFDPPVERMRS